MLLDYWYQEPIPTELDWVIGILGLVAFALAVLAMPSVAQMLWGRAQLRTEYKTDANGEDRSLIVFLSNPPVRQKFLKCIGLHRDAIQSLEACFQIREAGSGAVLDPIRHARLKSPDDPSDDFFSYRIVLPPTYSVGASLMIAIWDKISAKAVVPPDRLRPAIALSAGLYRVEIIFTIDGDPVKDSHNFKVGLRGDDLMWIESQS